MRGSKCYHRAKEVGENRDDLEPEEKKLILVHNMKDYDITTFAVQQF